MEMSDAELIYNALLRAERKLEPPEGTAIMTAAMIERVAAFRALRALREEIGTGLARRAKQNEPASG